MSTCLFVGCGRVARPTCSPPSARADTSRPAQPQSAPKPPWPERKAAYLERLRGEPASVLRISLADKLHNLRSVATDLARIGDDVWGRFNADRDAQAWYCRELLAIFEQHIPSSRNLPEFQRLVAEVF